jgi:hypothetical protein
MNYDDLLAAAQQNPAEADFHTLRMAYAQSDAYAPYAHDAESVEGLNASLRAGNPQAAFEAAQRLLAANYLDIEAHMAADFVFVQSGDEAQSAYHRAFARGLIRAIMATGDGRDVDSAWIVLSISEEYTVLRVLGLQFKSQRLMQHEGHVFDVLSTRHNETGDEREVFFNIDLPNGWLSRNMGR